MAKEMTPETAQTTDLQHNAKARAAAIRKLAGNLRPHEEAIAVEKASMKKLRKEFTADTGITMADFDAARRLADLDDDDERHTKLDNLAECFSALRPGEQLDWITAAQKEQAPEEEEAPAEQVH